jgi:hypothetical protein
MYLPTDRQRVSGGEIMFFQQLTQRALLILMATITIALGTQAQAQAQEEPDSGYFSIQDKAKSKVWLQDPQTALIKGFESVISAASRLSLMKWRRFEEALPEPSEAYNRRYHFGSWVNDPFDQTCYNTRAKILMKTSEVPVTFKEHNRCMVDKGRWQDPYTGLVRHEARDIQIDHVVPLKNAFDSGAWTWNAEQRCLFANFMANDYHLMPVDGYENMSKGDSAPDQYLPPQRRYVCDYLRSWLKIKLIWKLEMTAPEAQSIRQAVKDYGCASDSLIMSETELAKQRTATQEMQKICKRATERSKYHSQEFISPP